MCTLFSLRKSNVRIFLYDTHFAENVKYLFFSLRKWKVKIFPPNDYVFHWCEKIIRKWAVPIWPVSFRFSFSIRDVTYMVCFILKHMHTNINVCIIYNLLATHLFTSLATSIFMPVPDFTFWFIFIHWIWHLVNYFFQ